MPRRSTSTRRSFRPRPPPTGAFAPIPSAAGKAKSYDAWRKQFAMLVLPRGVSLQLFRRAPSHQDEQAGRVGMRFPRRGCSRRRGSGGTRRSTKLRQPRHAGKFATLQERLRRAQAGGRALAREGRARRNGTPRCRSARRCSARSSAARRPWPRHGRPRDHRRPRAAAAQ